MVASTEEDATNPDTALAAACALFADMVSTKLMRSFVAAVSTGHLKCSPMCSQHALVKLIRVRPTR
eukprot:2784486-Amphidinium_carterae.1